VSHLYRIVSANRLEGVGSTDEQLARRSSYQNTDVVLTVFLQAQTHLISRGLIKTLRTHVVTTFHLTEYNQLLFCSTWFLELRTARGHSKRMFYVKSYSKKLPITFKRAGILHLFTNLPFSVSVLKHFCFTGLSSSKLLC